jgi:hypothetical protein
VFERQLLLEAGIDAKLHHEQHRRRAGRKSSRMSGRILNTAFSNAGCCQEFTSCIGQSFLAGKNHGAVIGKQDGCIVAAEAILAPVETPVSGW